MVHDAASKLDVCACWALLEYGGWLPPGDPYLNCTDQLPPYTEGVLRLKLQLQQCKGGFGVTPLRLLAVAGLAYSTATACFLQWLCNEIL